MNATELIKKKSRSGGGRVHEDEVGTPSYQGEHSRGLEPPSMILDT